jgi:hypothetical protein
METEVAMERFTGKLEWITMGGRLDVRHPDGRLVRTGWAYGDLYRKACALGKKATVDVEMSANPATWPRVVAIHDSTNQSELV